LLLWNNLQDVGADSATLAAYNALLGVPTAGFTIRAGDPLTLSANRPAGDTPALSFGWDLTSGGAYGDASGATIQLTWSQLVGLGISDVDVYPVGLQVTDGTTIATFATTLTVNPRSPLVVVSTATAGGLANVSKNYDTLGAFRHGIDGGAALPLSSYSAAIDWGDGSPVETSAGPNVTIRLDASGTTILVSGTHTYAASQVYHPSVTLSTSTESVTATPTIHVAADASGSASFQSSALTYNSTDNVFEGQLTVTNTGAAGLNGTLLILLSGLTPDVSLAGATLTVGTTTYTLAITTTDAGDPVITIPQSVLASLAVGQSLTMTLRFRDPLLDPINYTPLLFSDPLGG
jgi:hypothetical protein